MVGGGAAVLSALLAWQGTTELEAGGSVDTRVGRAPVLSATTVDQVGLTERNQVQLAATPMLRIRWTGERGELRAMSSGRVLWRPAPYGDRRPLFLETLEVAHSARPSRRSRWQLDLRSTYGEEDYTSLLRQFGSSQPQLPNAFNMFTVNAFGDGSWRASRRTTLSLVANGTYRRSLDNPPDAALGTSGGFVLPPQTQMVVALAGRYALDRRTSLEVRAGVGDVDIGRLDPSRSGRTNILTFQPEVGLIRALSRAQELRLSAGLTYAAVLSSPGGNRNWRPLTPLFRGDLSSVLWRTSAASLRSLLGFEGAWYADPILGVAVGRVTTFANLIAQLSPRWGAGLRASFTTDVNAPVWVGDRPLDETMVQLDLPFRYRWSSQLVMELGARYSERAPNLRADEFAWHYRELWAFVTLTGTTHRTRTRPGPTARPASSPIPGTPPPVPTDSSTTRS